MNKLVKISLASLLAYTVQGSALDGLDETYGRMLKRQGSGKGEEKRAEKAAKAKGGKGGKSRSKGVGFKSFYGDEVPHLRGKCLVKRAGSRRMGRVILYQKLTEAGELEPSVMSARVRDLEADRVAIELFASDPLAEDAVDVAATDDLGEYMPSARGVVTVYGEFIDDVTLQGDDSVAGAFIGIRNVDDNSILGSCQIEVTEEGVEEEEPVEPVEPDANDLRRLDSDSESDDEESADESESSDEESSADEADSSDEEESAASSDEAEVPAEGDEADSGAV